jgi:hypothetical protein
MVCLRNICINTLHKGDSDDDDDDDDDDNNKVSTEVISGLNEQDDMDAKTSNFM